MRWSLIVLLTCLLCACVTAENEYDWPMFQHDLQHTGYSPSSIPEPLREVWCGEYGMSGLAYLVVSGEKIFMVKGPFLFSISITDGSILWKFEEKGWIDFWNFPTVAGNRIYVSGTDGIFCFDANRGKKIWHHEVKGIEFIYSPIVVGDHVVVGSGGIRDFDVAEYAKRIVCLNKKNGKLVWEYYASDIPGCIPAYLDGRVYMNTGRYIYCLDTQTGEVIWEKKTEWTNFSSLSLDGEKIFVGTSFGVACLDIETRDTIWQFDCGERLFTTPAVAYDKVFFGTLDGLFYCLNAQNGELVWKMETGSGTGDPQDRISCSALVADGKVAFGIGNGVLYIADAQSGEICESLQLSEDSIKSIIPSDGRLIVGDIEGRIFCFEGPPTPPENDDEKNHVSGKSFYQFILIILAAAIVLLVLKWHRDKNSD
jgi:outer membrane protein assembly factor BamB